ncbi:hypothetical protein [Microbulbifer sp. ALW1]|uniref:DUF7668 domain-containing protein n=1 Tax=Microbulbifer sp. (strain ALW1) TaxID=1516059 RepID=UPI00135CD0C6|nr:hypothetical protein [Microbulbifer sp. ALW1]
MVFTQVPVTKNDEIEGPIPTVWRPLFSSVVDCFVKKDYQISGGIEGVSSISTETARHIKDYIQDYGERLIPLPDETWESSVCIYMGNHWDVLIDLWTVGEGRSDLVLGAQVSEIDRGYVVDIGTVYVP